jgi:hypothetical protein
VCSSARVDSSGWPACELCGVRLKSKQPHRPHGAGRAHQSCIKSQSRAAAPSSKPIPRSKRPYDSLKPTQKRERRKRAREAVAQAAAEVGCPLEAIQPQPRITPEELLHFTTAERERIRTVPSLRIPCERTIIECKKLLATTHATETGTFADGAYNTDPVGFVSVLCAQSSVLVVGGDAGNGLTQLGVTYLEADKTQRFAALLVYRGKDSYDDLDTLQEPGLTPFKGESSAFPHIFAVLQHLIDSNVERAFLNGDWPFINTLLGRKNASAIHPCPICIISHNNLLGS